jgi:uncharacterized repeat protein (TIGR01451 family)
MEVTGSSDPLISNGRYDAYCLNPLAHIGFSPTSYLAQNSAGNTLTSFEPIGFSSLKQTQVNQLNWLLAQNFTSDPKFGGQFNYGEVQTAIWKIVGFTDSDIGTVDVRFLNGNDSSVAVSVNDINFLVSAAQSAVAIGDGVLPTDAFFTEVIDPAGDVQPLIVQLQSAKLGNYVWLDANGDGKQDSGEVGVNNVVVQLYATDGTTLLASTKTGDDYGTATVETGYYQFTGLKAGDYQVKFLTPADMMLTVKDANANTQDTIDSDANQTTGSTGTFHLNTGESKQTIDAGLYKTASISGYVYEDVGNDGVRNSEPPIIGVTIITLSGTDNHGNKVNATTTTLADGSYKFDTLLPGAYTVTETQPGYLDGKDSVGSASGSNTTNDVISNIVLTSGVDSINNNFGELVGAQIHGFVYSDGNNDGIKQDIESDLGGVAVTLSGIDDKGAAVSATTDTSGDGSYAFYSLRPGVYSVTEPTQPDGYLDGKDTAGAYGGGTASNDVITNITLTQGLISNDNNFGELKTSGISGNVKADIDNNNSGDVNLQNVTIELLDAGNAVIAATFTDADGNYSFIGQPAGSYTVRQTNLPGYVDVSDTVGANDNLIPVTLVAGSASTGNNFVDEQLGSISGNVKADIDNNNSGDVNLQNVTIELLDAGNAVIAATFTDADGNYSFIGQPAGSYTVRQTNLPGYVDVSDTVGANDNLIPVTLVAGGASTGNNFVDEQLGSLGDTVWYDKNANGIQDTGEAGISGVKVTLTGGGDDGFLSTLGDNTTSTTTTGSGGLYLFNSLTPGTQYQVAFAMPNGFNGASPRHQGADAAKDSDGVLSDVIVLTSGQPNQTIDAGFYKTGIDIEKWVHSQTTVENPGGGEGLTPGFWKNHCSYGPSPLTGWPETGRSPNDSFESIFGVNVSGSNPTLLNALGMNGGGENALLRHSAAALLNASDPYVDYAYSVTQVIAMTQAAYANGTFETTKNLFATQNELGADLTDLATSSTTVINGLDMDADLPGSGPTIGVGDKAVFTYIVTNTGDTAIGNVTVTDNRLAGVAYVDGDVNGNHLLDLKEIWTYTASETVVGSGDIGNIGKVTGTSVVAGGPNVTDSDAAYYKIASFAALGNRVWEDANANGIQDAGEKGIANVTVKLLGSAGAVLQTTATDTNGKYGFDVHAGSYKVQVINPTGYYATKQDQGSNDGVDSDINTSGMTGLVTVATGQQNLTIDAGLYKKAGIGNLVWEDKNYNGIQDSGENGIANVTVKLLGSAGAVLQTTATDANGKYGFDVDAGSYKVQVINPAGYYATKQDQGSNDGIDSDINTSGMTGLVTVTAGQQNLTIDASLYLKASVGNKVWDDMNHNNIQDASEPGIGCITVNLMDATGASVLATTTTNSNGNYLFANLDPGSYVLQFDKANVQHYNYGAWYSMSNWKWAVKDAGANDAIDSDVVGDAKATANVTKTDVFTLISSQNDMTKDAGITPIVIDLNGDGIHTVSRANSVDTFDLLGNGKEIQSGWLSKDDGFLAIDSNGNGLIDNISELFGGLNKGDGFSKLSSFDSNGDGLVNFSDNDFAGLKIWQDANGNHQTDTGELFSLTEAGVTSLNVNFNEMPFLDAQGNLLLERSSATLADGNAAEMTDVYFNVSAVDAAAAGVEAPNLVNLVGADPFWMI